MVLIWLIKGVFYKFFLLYIKIRESAYLTYYQRTRGVILNKAKDYYENYKDRLRKQARDKYRNLSEEEEEEEEEKKKNMRKIDITICLKRRKKDWKNIKKDIARQKSLNIIMNKKVFYL